MAAPTWLCDTTFFLCREPLTQGLTALWAEARRQSPTIACEGSRRFIEVVAADDKTLWLVEGGYHELLNDRGAPAALAEVLGWIEARI